MRVRGTSVFKYCQIIAPRLYWKFHRAALPHSLKQLGMEHSKNGKLSVLNGEIKANSLRLQIRLKLFIVFEWMSAKES